MKRLYYLRISTLPLSLGNESCVIRIVPQYFQTKRESYEFKDFKHFMKKKQGLLLFSGPTGSGKSTFNVPNGPLCTSKFEFKCNIS